jgi:hypothetical protein
MARSLRAQLTTCDNLPGHVEILNMLARSTGYRNFQHFRSQFTAKVGLDRTRPVPAPVDYVQVRRVIRYFDESGRLIHWPGKFSHREPCLWVLWSRLPARQRLTEPEVNQLLQSSHLFGDPALLRRSLHDYGLVTRTPDCREYRRVERQPSPEALALIRSLGERLAA